MLIKGGQVVNADRQGSAEEFIAVGSLASADAGGGAISLANPFETEVIVTDVMIDVTTGTTASATADIGISAGATTSADNLIDGVNVGVTGVGGSPRIFNGQKDAGTNGIGAKSWSTTQYFTMSKASGALAGLVGRYTIKAIKRA